LLKDKSIHCIIRIFASKEKPFIMNEEERYDDIIKRFEAMLRTNENIFFDLEDFLEIVDEYISLGNFNMAVKALEIGLEQYPDNVELLLFRVELYSFDDQLDKAHALIQQLKQVAPDRVEIPMLEAELCSRKHQHKDAIAALQKALQFEEADPVEIYEIMTVEYLYLEDYRAALDTSLKTLKLDPDSSTALYNAVTCFDLLDETEKAVRFLEQHVEKYPFSEVGWSLLAKKYIDKAQYQKAISALDYAIAIDDHFLGAYYDKAYAYTQTKQYDKALECYRLTLKIADPTAFTYYHIAQIYQLKKELNNAVHYYFKAIEEDPGYYKSWIKLINIKLEQGLPNDALSITHKALEVINNQELFELLGKIYLLMNEPQKAVPAFEMSLKLGTPSLPVILQLADLYKQNNRLDDYRSLLLEARNNFPESDEIKRRMLEK